MAQIICSDIQNEVKQADYFQDVSADSTTVATAAVALSEVRGDLPADLDLQLWGLFTATASAHPDREALVCLWQPGCNGQDQSRSVPDPTSPSEQLSLSPPSSSSESSAGAASSSSTCLRWTYRNLQTQAERLSSILEAQGCRPGMHLAVILWNCAEWGLLFWAAARLGMAFVPMDPRAGDDVPLMLEAVQPSVLVVQDGEAVAALDLHEQQQPDGGGIPPSPHILLRVHCSDQVVDGWLGLRQLLSLSPLEERLPQMKLIPGVTTPPSEDDENTSNDNKDKDIEGPSRASAPALIVFTSGTTGRPKGCLHTTRNLVSQTHTYDPNPNPSQVDRWLVHTPVAHIFAINNALRAWRLGDTVVFAAKSFSVDATARALVREHCTIMSATPTLARALLSHNDIILPGPRDVLHLNLVSVAGTMIGTGDIRLCREGLGARDAIQAYGMSEGAPLISWSRQDDMLVDGYHPGVGKTLPGAWIRICRPGTRMPLPRTQIGELHVSGPSVISGYLGDVDSDKFYNDTSGRWLMTGDQAMMTEKGVVHILGRYKDLIIRGGENINPLTIESALNESFPGLDAHVVGLADHMAGQVPVAVVKQLPKDISKSQLVRRARLIGQQYTLCGVYTLRELGLDALPVTSLGKPKKAILANLVAKRRSPDSKVKPPHRQTEVCTALFDLEEQLLTAWELVAGTRPSRTESVLYYADSITLLRYCDAVHRSCGRQVYLEDIKRGDSVEKLARLLIVAKRCAEEPRHHENKKKRKRSSVDNGQGVAPAKRQLFWPDPDDDLNHDLEKAAQARIKQFDLVHGKVEDIIPIRYSLHRMVLGERPQSYHVRIVFRVKKPVSREQIYQGLVKAIGSRPMMRTMLLVHAHPAQDETQYHAVLSPNKELFGRLIQRVQVRTEEDARRVCEDSSAESHPYDFMFRAAIIEVAQTRQLMLSLTYNHSIVDALSLLPWHRDLDRLISNNDAKLQSQTPYRLFTDLLAQFESSAPSGRSVSFHASRLRGISRCRKALWPERRAPGMFISHDMDSPSASHRRTSRNKIWNVSNWDAEPLATEFRFPRRSRVVQLPNLPKLRDSYGVESMLFMTCALSIFNTIQTRSQIAIFNSWECGRSWPFLPPWVESFLPPASSIDGPTFQWMLNMLEVRGNESLAEFFQRIKRERELIQQHVHAPWDKILVELREEADVAVDASFRQSFVWDISMGVAASRGFQDDFESLQPVSRYDWPDCGLFWNAFMVDDTNLFFIASWDTAQMNADEMDGHCDGLSAVMRELAKEENWTRPMEEIFPKT